MIFEAKLSPKAGYAEVEVNGERTYRNIETGVLIEDEIPTSTPEERIAALESATVITFVTLCEAGSIDAVTASEHVDLFSPWAYPVSYKTGQIREHGGKLYKCLQDHTSQETWTPDASPSLWVAISDPAEEWPEWSQPVGSTDAYAKGAKVSHSGKQWTSDVDNNVWEPGVYGWAEVTEA